MDTLNTDPSLPSNPGANAELQQRHVSESEGLERAWASIAAGYSATSAEVYAWIDSLGTAARVPVPHPRLPRPR
jgi:hypothetical protein